MAEAAEWDVIEGFLCPICMKDLKSVHQLQSHFDSEHGSEDKVVLQSIKGFLSKATKIIMKSDDTDPAFSSKVLNAFPEQSASKDLNNPWNWTCPVATAGKSHMTVFKKLRSSRIDSQVAETNKLIIRLDKLLTNIPSDPSKRKAHEKNIVIWADDKDVPLCPYCAKSFNIAKRRHHCRLCGAVMCDDCSLDLPFHYAEKLVFPIHQGQRQVPVPVSTPEKKFRNTLSILASNVNPLRRAGSQGSLNSLLSVVDGTNKEKSFRSCQDCMKRLHVRDRQTVQREFKPMLSLYYSKLMEQKAQLLDYLPQYEKLATAINNGDSNVTLSDAIELRVQILRLSDQMTGYGQKIRDLGKSGVEPETDAPRDEDGPLPAGPRQAILQRRIHSTIFSCLKENVLSLTKLPDADEYGRKVRRKREEAEARLASRTKGVREKSASRSSRKKTESYDIPKKNSEVKVENGWSGDVASHCITETDDPIIQQMNIIRVYIKQAREANKQDEVEALEMNLKELQEEYKRQKM